MNLIFWTRVVCTVYVISFVVKLIFGSRPISWLDWMSGIAFAISIYYLTPVVEKFIRGRRRRR
ncbi:MAG: hypothetical protein IJS69_01010 [Selenomonadaceae bacterium]|nr:hypothetical protein [Selenomonadaceae bacterium]